MTIEHRGKWEVLDREVVYVNDPHMVVHSDRVVCPDATEGTYGWLEGLAGVYVVPVTASGEVYMVDTFRYPLNDRSLEVVSGGLESGESYLEAAQRELREEVGLSAHMWHTLAGPVHAAPHIQTAPQYIFLARDLQHIVSEGDAKEDLHSVCMPLSRALTFARSGAIIESTSIAALFLADSYLTYVQKKSNLHRR